MAVRRDIVCPCGHYLGSTNNTSGGGEKICTTCKKRIKYTITPNGVYTAIKR